jgi:hypothetical protein
MKARTFYLSFFIVAFSVSNAYCQPKKPVASGLKSNQSITSGWYLKPVFKKGDTLGNIYSRTIAYSGKDFKDTVRRISGTSIYTVIDDNSAKPIFNETDLYDGRPVSTGRSSIEFSGKGSFNGQEFVNTSASGLLYSEVVWGKLPSLLHEGDSWKSNIKQAWELGGPGVQKVTVVTLDEKHHTVMLKRDGISEGFYDSDPTQLEIRKNDGEKLKMNLAPGQSHWTGYTIIRSGVIISDELLVIRDFTLSAGDIVFRGKERQYILLNAMPAEAYQN